VRLFTKDVESGLMLEELGLKGLNACRGRQILASQPRAHVDSRVLHESAARPQTSPHTFQRQMYEHRLGRRVKKRNKHN